MKVICSYCRKFLSDKEPFDDKRVSHTVCPECYVYYKEQWEGLSFEKYLDKFDVPVLIMDTDYRIVAANRKAADLTGRKQREVTGLLPGEAVECAYSRLPEGCGETVHCETCTIRQAVRKAIESGQPQEHVPVKIKKDGEVVEMIISTEKIGEVVRMIIEDRG